MIEQSSGGATLRIAPATPSSVPAPQRHLDRNMLLHGIAARRRRLAQLETSMAEACERAAVGGACRKLPTNDHDTWDKATWQRYLVAVARLEPGLHAQDAQTAAGHRQIRAPADAADGGRGRCMSQYRSTALQDEHRGQRFTGIERS
jgi:hypothetical protein